MVGGAGAGAMAGHACVSQLLGYMKPENEKSFFGVCHKLLTHPVVVPIILANCTAIGTASELLSRLP